MDSGLWAVDWSNLPAELLILICRDLGNAPAEIVPIRSVCRWWRLSIPRPPNKLSAIFPLEPSMLGDPVATNALRPYVLGDSSPEFHFVINASAVYLVRSRSDPTKACMVSVQEASPGNLVLRHPLVFKQIFNSPVDVDWISATQTLLAKSYARNETCFNCRQVVGTLKMVFVLDSASRCRGLVGFCENGGGNAFAFRRDLIGRATTSSSSSPSHQLHSEFFSGDVVAFNGRIIAIDCQGRIYALDHTSLNLVQLNSVTLPSPDPLEGSRPELHLVVSDGDLYLVVICDCPLLCQTYRLVISTVDDEDNPTPISSLVVEEVDDLGDDRVFFITMTGSFSVSARHLPHPWKGNCIVYRHMPSTMCECNKVWPNIYPDYELEHGIFFLGGRQNPRYVSISRLQGYSDLISPGPLLLQIKDLDLEHNAEIMD